MPAMVVTARAEPAGVVSKTSASVLQPLFTGHCAPLREKEEDEMALVVSVRWGDNGGEGLAGIPATWRWTDCRKSEQRERRKQRGSGGVARRGELVERRGGVAERRGGGR